MEFKSEVDWWYYLLILVVLSVVLFALFPALKRGQLSMVSAVAIAILSIGLPVWLLVGTLYSVADESLKIKSGPFSWNIPLSEIHSVRPSRSSRSSPALSLDRLEISYGNGRSILVSPANRDSFLAAVGQSIEDTP